MQLILFWVTPMAHSFSKTRDIFTSVAPFQTTNLFTKHVGFAHCSIDGQLSQ